MLEAIRRNVSGILAKVLIGLLVVSFAVWGIGDMVRSYGRDVVATVGGSEINTRDFRTTYQNQLDAISRQFGRRLTPQEAKIFGIERQVLSQLTGAAAVDNHTGELKLDLSDKAVEQGVYEDPMFQGADGQFLPGLLQQVLRQSGLSEQQFFEARKRDTLRNHITTSMLSNVAPPKVMTELLRTYRGEERIAKYLEVTPEKAVKLDEPTEADLKQAYETNKREFVTPEYRKFEALLLTEAAAKQKLDISEAELKTIYEAEKASFSIPEKRRIFQIPFEDEAAATAARAEITAGKSFLDVAKAAGAKEGDIDLGMMGKDALIDTAVAEAAFKLGKDEVSAPVKGRFSTVLLRVTEIKEGEQRTFEEVKGDIRARIEEDRVADKVQEIQNNIDDNRLAGKSLKEIGDILKLPYISVEAADNKGNTPDGKPALDQQDKDTLTTKAFESEVGVENEVLQLSGEGVAWLNLIAVTPEKQKEFKDVTEDVKKVWREMETRKKLREVTTAMAERLNSGETLETIAAEIGATVKTTPAFKRGDSVPDLPAPTVSRVFAVKKNVATDAAGTNADTRIVLRVTEVSPPKELTEAEAKALREQTEAQLRSDVIAQYVADLQKRMDVQINQALIDQTTGASAANASF